MSVVLARQWGNNVGFKRGTVSEHRPFSVKPARPGKAKSNTIAADRADFSNDIFVMVACIIFATAFYLFQVNNIAIQSYAIRDAQNKVLNLQKESQKLKIQETESRSMYTIEKATENLNLVNAANVSYVEMKGPMAMK
jgi:hypothetical protein